MSILIKLKEIANQQGYTFASLERELGFGNGTIHKWDLNSPSVDKLVKVANFLCVSVDYLLGISEEKDLNLENPGQIFWNKFVELCIKNNTKPNPVAKELGISSGTVTGWKNGAVPNSTTVLRICEHFGVSSDYFSETKASEFEATTTQEKELLKSFRKLSELGKARIILLVDRIMSDESNKFGKIAAYGGKEDIYNDKIKK